MTGRRVTKQCENKWSTALKPLRPLDRFVARFSRDFDDVDGDIDAVSLTWGSVRPSRRLEGEAGLR